MFDPSLHERETVLFVYSRHFKFYANFLVSVNCDEMHEGEASSIKVSNEIIAASSL